MLTSMRVVLPAARPVLPPFAAMGLLWGSFMACVPDILDGLGVVEAELGLLMLGAPTAAVLAMFLAPQIGTVLGRVALPLATLAMALGFVLPGQAQALWVFALGMALAGATTGLTDVLMNARVAAIEADRNLPLMNLCHAAYSFGYAGGAMAAGVLRSQGYGPALVLAITACLAACLALAAWEADGRIHGLARPKNRIDARLGAVPVLGGMLVLIAFLTENAAEAWSALHIEQTLGGSPAEGASGPALLALTMGIARLAGQGLIARVAPLRLLTGGALLASAGAMIAALATSPAMAQAGFVVMGLGASVIAPTAFSLVGHMARPEARARAIARATMLGYAGYFFGPPVLGIVATLISLRGAFVVAALALCLVPPVAARLLRAGR